MGIFDSLKNMTNQAVKNNVSKAVSGAVNNAMHKSKTFVLFVTSFNSGICNACVA